MNNLRTEIEYKLAAFKFLKHLNKKKTSFKEKSPHSIRQPTTSSILQSVKQFITAC